MTKKELISKIINHERRGEDALWLADEYRTDVPKHDAKLAEAARMLLEGADLFYNRLEDLDDELELNLLGN